MEESDATSVFAVAVLGFWSNKEYSYLFHSELSSGESTGGFEQRTIIIERKIVFDAMPLLMVSLSPTIDVEHTNSRLVLV